MSRVEKTTLEFMGYKSLESFLKRPGPKVMNKLFIVVLITLIALALSAPEDYVEPSIEDEVSEDFE